MIRLQRITERVSDTTGTDKNRYASRLTGI